MTAIRTFFNRPADASLAEETGPSYWTILRVNLFSFFNLVLFAVSVILLVFGRYNDALITLSTGLTSAFINSFQEIRAKRQLDQISVLVRPTATVLRSGMPEQIAATALAPDDLIRLRGGDQALADGLVTDGVAEIDESLLTGESDLISKRAGETIFSGSFCVTGELIYRATAVGRTSFAGQLTTQARQATNVATPLQQQVTLVIRLLMTLTVILALLFYITGFMLNLTFLSNAFPGGFPQPLHIAHWRRAKETFVFPVEVGGVVVPHAIASTGRVEVSAQQQTTGFLEP